MSSALTLKAGDPSCPYPHPITPAWDTPPPPQPPSSVTPPPCPQEASLSAHSHLPSSIPRNRREEAGHLGPSDLESQRPQASPPSPQGRHLCGGEDKDWSSGRLERLAQPWEPPLGASELPSWPSGPSAQVAKSHSNELKRQSMCSQGDRLPTTNNYSKKEIAPV